MSMLKTIIDFKKNEVRENKGRRSVRSLEQSPFFNANIISLKTHLKRGDMVGIIAEFKRRSPSEGLINNKVSVEKLSKAYIQAGASALSILTDYNFFGGKNQDVETARKFNNCPILRKEFIIDEYQIIEAKSIGADCILLIASCLAPKQCKSLANFAKSLELEVLLEVRTKEEIDSHTNEHVDLIGVNNRNLNDFSTDISNSKLLFEYLPKELVKISESGITQASQIKTLKDDGYDGFLVGSLFMKHKEPDQICENLINNYKLLSE